MKLSKTQSGGAMARVRRAVVALLGIFTSFVHGQSMNSISVHLLDSGGSSVNGAIIQVGKQFGPSIQRTCQQTADGLYECQFGPALHALLIITHPDYGMTTRVLPGPLRDVQDVLVVLEVALPRTSVKRRIEGRVVDRMPGHEHEAIWVRVVRLGDYALLRDIRVDSDDGRFVVEHIDPGDYLMAVLEHVASVPLKYCGFHQVEVSIADEVVHASLSACGVAK